PPHDARHWGVDACVSGQGAGAISSRTPGCVFLPLLPSRTGGCFPGGRMKGLEPSVNLCGDFLEFLARGTRRVPPEPCLLKMPAIAGGATWSRVSSSTGGTAYGRENRLRSAPIVPGPPLSLARALAGPIALGAIGDRNKPPAAFCGLSIASRMLPRATTGKRITSNSSYLLGISTLCRATLGCIQNSDFAAAFAASTSGL